MEKNYFLEKIS